MLVLIVNFKGVKLKVCKSSVFGLMLPMVEISARSSAKDTVTFFPLQFIA